MASTMTKDMEALVDLFLLSTFDPFKPDTLIARSDSAKPHSDAHEGFFSDELGAETDDEDEDDDVEYEAAVDSDEEDEADAEADAHPVQPVLQSVQTAKHCGQILARLGDEFFHSHQQMRDSSSASAVPTWKTVGEQLKSVFMTVSQMNDTDPDAEQKKEKAWQDFKAILNNSVSDNGVGDAFKILGALLLSLHGLSELMSGVKGLARSYFIRYIRERELDVEMQRMGGLTIVVNDSGSPRHSQHSSQKQYLHCLQIFPDLFVQFPIYQIFWELLEKEKWIEI